MTTFRRRLSFPLLLWALAAGCGPGASQDAPPEEGRVPSNRIDVPEAVRRNLGITFAAVERRRVAATLRLPGAFELLPSGRHEHRAPLAGRVLPQVQPLQRVEPGEVLFRLDAPDWRRMQRELGDLETASTVTAAHLRATRPLLAAHQVHEQSLREAFAVQQQRVRSLEATEAEVGGQAQALAEARVQLAQVQAQIAETAEKHTETEARIAELEADQAAGRQRLELLLAAAATMHGRPAAELAAAWRTIDGIDVRAMAAGLVERLPAATGAWVEANELVAVSVDPAAVRFRARALQSDLGRLRDGLPCRLVPAGAAAASGHLAGALQLGTEADPRQRTIDLFVRPEGAAAFARAGVAAFVEIETMAGGDAELAIPRACVLQDGLVRVFFRRDPADPDKVIRTEADLGVDDGAWVEIKSGLADGDQVVAAGAYELVLASSGTAQRGGHFHADGTWHADHK